MRLLTLHLSNVRNYAQLDLEPALGLNLFVGANAQGKSNLLEAIALLGTGKSFRTARERDLICEGMDLASISGEAQLRSGVVRLGCTLSSGLRGARKRFAINGQSVRYARFLGSVRVVTFVPADLHLVSGPPAQRRAFLNEALAQEMSGYYRDFARYQKTLAQKSALLRDPRGGDDDLLDVYNHALVEAGTPIIMARYAFVHQLAQRAALVHERWSAGGERLDLRYEPNIVAEAPAADAVAQAFHARLHEVREQERIRGSALAGPHRDELRLLLDGRSLSAYGSQGQQRTAVLALKVGEYGVMLERTGEAPLLLLDDVLSELDEARSGAFLQAVEGFEQAFITATHVPSALRAARIYDVVQARVTARTAA